MRNTIVPLLLPRIEPIENECTRAADVQIAGRRGRKTNPNHEVSVYESVLHF